MREAATIRAAQAITAGLQAAFGLAGVTDLLPTKLVLAFAMVVAFGQVGLATWNSGLHNQPAKPADVKLY